MPSISRGTFGSCRSHSHIKKLSALASLLPSTTRRPGGMICLYPLSAHRDPANGAVVVRPPPMLPFILADPNLVLELSGYRPIRGAPFDCQGVLWFTGQNGVYGRLDPKSGMMAVFDAPRGAGPYGIATDLGAARCRGKAHGACGTTAAARSGRPSVFRFPCGQLSRSVRCRDRHHHASAKPFSPTRNFHRLGLVRPLIDAKYRSRSNELRGNSLRVGTGNFLAPNRELNRVIREFFTLIRESRFWVVPPGFAR